MAAMAARELVSSASSVKILCFELHACRQS